MASGNGREGEGFLDGLVGERSGGLSSACMSVLYGAGKEVVVEPRTKVRFPLLLCENGATETSDNRDQCQVSILPTKLKGESLLRTFSTSQADRCHRGQIGRLHSASVDRYSYKESREV